MLNVSPADLFFVFVSFFFIVIMRCGVQIPGAPALCRLILLLSHVCDVMLGRIDKVLQWRSGHKETGSLHGDDKAKTPCSNFLYFRSI